MDMVITLGPIEATLTVAGLLIAVGFLGKTIYQRLEDRITETQEDFLDRVKYLHTRVDQLIGMLQQHSDRETRRSDR